MNWINVKNELPKLIDEDFSDYVIVLDKYKNFHKAFYSKKLNHWVICQSERDDDVESDDITHWATVELP